MKQAIAVIAFVACNRGTPAGTELVVWQRAGTNATPPHFVTEEVDCMFDRGKARYRFETDVGVVTVAGSLPATGPRSIRITVLDSAGTTQTANCMDTPSTTTGPDGGTLVSVSCFVNAQQAKDGQRLFVVDGNGHVESRPIGAPTR